MYTRSPTAPVACSCRSRDVPEMQCSCAHCRLPPAHLQLQLCTARSSWMQVLRRRGWSLLRTSRHVMQITAVQSIVHCSGVCHPSSSPRRVLFGLLFSRKSCRGGYSTLPLTQRVALLKPTGPTSRSARSVADPELHRCGALQGPTPLPPTDCAACCLFCRAVQSASE